MLYYILTADDEEPDCGRCMYVTASQKICDECGAAWKNYRREVFEEEEDNESY